ncbi:MAG: hypothetical protein IKR78_04930, partial [Dehalococcoidales bacterium]|nr:hypothetical protein [Dehalococcoidales bacterium]
MKLNKVLKTLTIGLILALLCIPLFVTPVSASVVPLNVSTDEVIRGETVTLSGTYPGDLDVHATYLITFSYNKRGESQKTFFVRDIPVSNVNGKFTYDWVMPLDMDLGQYTIEGVVSTVGGGPRDPYFSANIEVKDKPAEPNMSIDKNKDLIEGDFITLKAFSLPNGNYSIKVDGNEVASQTVVSGTLTYRYKVTKLATGVVHNISLTGSTGVDLSKSFQVKADAELSLNTGNPETPLV